MVDVTQSDNTLLAHAELTHPAYVEGTAVSVASWFAGMVYVYMAAILAAAKEKWQAIEAAEAAGGAADPLLNAVPGAYGSGTAGEALGYIDDIKTKTDLISSGTAITITSPVTSDQDVEITAGDDFSSAGSNRLTWTEADYTGPDLSAATVTFRCQLTSLYEAGAGAVALEVAGTISIDGTTNTYYVALTAVQTAALSPTPPADKKAYTYDLTVTLATGETITKAVGAMTVLRDVRA